MTQFDAENLFAGIFAYEELNHPVLHAKCKLLLTISTAESFGRLGRAGLHLLLDRGYMEARKEEL